MSNRVIICGVDEAGRGPVIGPMVMVAVTIDEKNLCIDICISTIFRICTG